MRKRWPAAGVALVVVAFGAFGMLKMSAAYDHQDGPRTLADPQTDIAGLYAFMAPNPNDAGVQQPSNRLVLIMTLNPQVSAAGKFTDHAEYAFVIHTVTSINPLTYGPADLRVRCIIVDATPQLVTCSAPGVGFRTVASGELDAGAGASDFQVFAGFRSDPAAFDKAAFDDSVKSGSLKFKSPGVNAYAGQKVLSIVVELNAPKAFLPPSEGGPPPTIPMLAVAAETTRF